MLHSGLVSISFRNLKPTEIVDLVQQAGLEAIEWGGDVHVPHGDFQQARAVHHLTEDAGLRVAAYGSYYCLAASDDQPPYEAVLETAAELKAPLIRVWAGDRASAQADHTFRQQVVQESQLIGEEAAQMGIAVAYEFHGHSLTDDADSARQLLLDVAHPNVHCYWQPPTVDPVDQNLAGLEKIIDWLSNVHVFTWGSNHERFHLAHGSEPWRQYLQKIAPVPGDRFALLEFLKDDDPQQFLADAQTLKQWLQPWNTQRSD